MNAEVVCGGVSTKCQKFVLKLDATVGLILCKGWSCPDGQFAICFDLSP